jgi:hypothetical protein
MFFVFCFFCFGLSSSLQARPLPEKFTAALLLKLVVLEKGLAEKRELHIHVLDNMLLTEALIDMSKRRRADMLALTITGSSKLPLEVPDVLFIGDRAATERGIQYCEEHKVMSVSDNVALSPAGASLVLYDDDGLPGIILNLATSRKERLHWQAQILEIAEPVD